MLYPIYIEKDQDSDYTVVAPDLPGLITAGDSYSDALAMAKDAIDGHVECLAELDESIPNGSTLDEYAENPNYQSGVWALVEVDITPYLGKAKKINVTLPGLLINKIDNAVLDHKGRYGDRSKFLALAAMKELNLD